jgi:hypothetical protein
LLFVWTFMHAFEAENLSGTDINENIGLHFFSCQCYNVEKQTKYLWQLGCRLSQRGKVWKHGLT